MLKIGISAAFEHPNDSRAVFAPKTLAYVEGEMLEYITQQGILPVMIPNVKEERLNEIVDALDAFIFQGGADMAPASYGEEAIIPGKWKGDIYRDRYELRLFDLALKSGKPIFGICRGMQVMNVYFGGSLYQDISTQNKAAIEHRNAEKYDALGHEVEFTPNSFLHKLYPQVDAPKVNSVHHQAIKELGAGLEVVGVSPDDGIIEAITLSSSPGRVFAVQWHPEFAQSPEGEFISGSPLFSWFTQQIGKR